MSVHPYRAAAIQPKPQSDGSWWATEQAQTREGFKALQEKAQIRLSGVSERKLPDHVGEGSR